MRGFEARLALRRYIPCPAAETLECHLLPCDRLAAWHTHGLLLVPRAGGARGSCALAASRTEAICAVQAAATVVGITSGTAAGTVHRIPPQHPQRIEGVRHRGKIPLAQAPLRALALIFTGVAGVAGAARRAARTHTRRRKPAAEGFGRALVRR
jgi:hypothetical protein